MLKILATTLIFICAGITLTFAGLRFLDVLNIVRIDSTHNTVSGNPLTIFIAIGLAITAILIAVIAIVTRNKNVNSR